MRDLAGRDLPAAHAQTGGGEGVERRIVLLREPDANGRRNLERGIPQFVVGTGGRSLRRFPHIEPNSEVRDRSTFGVLELTLGAGAFAWRFRPAVGTFTDSGSARCH